MTEVIEHPRTAVDWLQVLHGGHARWSDLLSGYGACLDWPSMAFWRELSDFYPDAKILLSVRDSDDWWESISQTVLASAPTRQSSRTPWDLMVVELFERKFVGRHPTREQAIEEFNRHNQEVREHIPSERLIEWSLGDGWEPLCEALGVPVPTNDFPHLNTSQEYRIKNRLETA